MMEMGLLVGIFFMAFVTPYMLAKGVWILNYDSIEMLDKVKCMVPVYNGFSSERMYTGGVPTVFITTVLSILLFIIRLIEVVVKVNETVAGITIILLILAILSNYICNAILVFRIIHDADSTSLPVTITFTILFPLGQYYIGQILPRVLRNSIKEESTFLD